MAACDFYGSSCRPYPAGGQPHDGRRSVRHYPLLVHSAGRLRPRVSCVGRGEPRALIQGVYEKMLNAKMSHSSNFFPFFVIEE